VIADGPEPGSWRGLAELAEDARRLLGAWEGYRAEADEYREVDDERVLVLIRRIGRGKTADWRLRRREQPCSNSAAAR
jgi:hypothetical protein